MIKTLREQKGLTQPQLARKIHLSKSHVSRMENTKKGKTKGYRASYTTIKLLAKHLEECPLRIFAFFADVDCIYLYTGYNPEEDIKCEFKNCISRDCNNNSRKITRLIIENTKLKKQFRRQRRFKNNIFYAYRSPNIKSRN